MLIKNKKIQVHLEQVAGGFNMKKANEVKAMTVAANETTKNMFEKHIELVVTQACEYKITQAANNGENSVICEIPRTVIENGGNFLRGEQIAKDFLKSLGYSVFTSWKTNSNFVKTTLVLSIGW